MARPTPILALALLERDTPAHALMVNVDLAVVRHGTLMAAWGRDHFQRYSRDEYVGVYADEA